MRVKDIIHFSPKYPIQKIEFDNKEILIDAFKDRIQSYYINAADILNKSNHAFAAGAILLTAIDAISYFTEVGAVSTRIKSFCYQIQEIRTKAETYQNEFADRVNDEFRNGLIHEGRIKNGSQFSYDYPFLEIISDDCLVLNPEYFQKEVEIYFDLAIQKLNAHQSNYLLFRQRFKQTFEREIEKLK
jgi:hypothetical protein